MVFTITVCILHGHGRLHFFLNGILQLDRLAMKCGDIGEVKEEQMAGSLPPRYSFNGRSCRLQEYRRS